MTTTAGVDFTALRERINVRRSLPTPAMRRALRQSAGLSTLDVAEALDVSRQTISNWELGTRSPRGDYLTRYAALLSEIARLDRNSA